MLMSLPTSWPAPGRRLRLALSAPVIVATALACSPREAALLIRDVAVVDPASGVVRPGWDIATRGRVIVAVGPDLHPERNAVVVDGRGMYAIPGLWDVHVHLAGLDPLPRAPEQLVASGITSVRDMGGRTGELLRLRADIRSGSRVGPAIVAAGPTLNGAAHADFHRVVATPADATGAVQEIRAAGFDFVKVHNALAPETFFAICDAAKAAGLTVAGHVPHGVTTQEASERGLASLEHVEVLMETEIYRRDHPAPGIGEALATLDGPEGRALFDTMRRNGTAFTPTLAAYRAFVEGQDTAQGRAMGERLYSHLAQLVPQAHAAGVLILAGTDSRSNVGGSLHRELALLVAAGLAPLEALRAATVNPSTFLGRADRARLERGSEATLVLLAANPLDDISNTARIAGVVLAGRYLDPADLRRLHVGN